jgi:hypothetical protein
MKASVSPITEFRPASVSWVRRSSISSSVNQNVNSPRLTNGNNQLRESSILSHGENVTSLDDPTSSNIHSDNIRAAKYSSQSRISKKNLNENEQKQERTMSSLNNSRPASVTWVKRNSFYTSPDQTQQKKGSARNVNEKKLDTRLERLHGEDLTPLNALTRTGEQFGSSSHPNNTHTVKYHFQSSGSTTNRYLIEEEEDRKKEEKYRR